MRRIGELNTQRRAERFVAYLVAQGIEAQMREDGDRHAVWVLDEDQVAAAAEHLRAFNASPEAAVFDAPAPKTKANGGRGMSGAWGRRQNRGRFIDVRSEVFGRGSMAKTPVVIFMIVAAVLLTLLASSSAFRGVISLLAFSEFRGRQFPEIANGQVWRLVTPIFLHGGLLHLFFNMLWLYQFGGAVEKNEGSVYFGVLVLVMAALVNTAEYLMLGGPMFLGMSGIVYGLFGYVWIMARFEPASAYFMAQETAFFLVAWLVICILGLIPGVANTEHVAGLVVGALWGYIRSRRASRRRRRL